MDHPVGPVACKEDSPVKQPLDFAKDCTDHSNESGPVSEFFFANAADKPPNRQASYKEDSMKTFCCY